MWLFFTLSPRITSLCVYHYVDTKWQWNTVWAKCLNFNHDHVSLISHTLHLWNVAYCCVSTNGINWALGLWQEQREGGCTVFKGTCLRRQVLLKYKDTAHSDFFNWSNLRVPQQVHNLNKKSHDSSIVLVKLKHFVFWLKKKIKSLISPVE